jgi:AmmeMemoRadiSam system protein B
VEHPHVLLVATTDLSHYHPRPVARKLDDRIADLVRAFAPTSLWEELRRGRAEACGGDALVAVMLGAGIAGAERARVLSYQDSGASSGNTASVVGYLAAAIFRGAPHEEIPLTAVALESLPVEADALLGIAPA